MKAKNQRLALLLLAIVAVLIAVLLAMSALKDQAAYFYAPGDVAKAAPALDRAVRIGGMVKPGSLRRAPDGVTIHFTVMDETPHIIAVRFTGIPPDLFREGSGVVAEGRFQRDGLFVADEILAKHDENYMPPQLAGAKHESGSLK
ncbi:cytochrome c maturation protein CcmE [Sphingosinicella rhizophila]|uniref:Cytochrome c-type biogenesis protein CcmE n=1 Tax=Sphingosinicella rhizophila TaxID=3050082 RepID=A0ABU3Q2Z2_9SPHN|nr:cytochrome c maturation protein CcmE [Sphingosinicella sp. GR2756]MDT9597781.1 cytochrome c maturation protein CcmE [Sphingosinicella sp. GR2756]